MPPVDSLSAIFTFPQPTQVYTLSAPAQNQFAPTLMPNDWIKYCRSLDRMHSKSEIVSAINREADPKVRQMIGVLKDNFEMVKRTHGLYRSLVAKDRANL